MKKSMFLILGIISILLSSCGGIIPSITQITVPKEKGKKAPKRESKKKKERKVVKTRSLI